MSTCSKCDASLVDDDVFCTACGAAVESSQPVITDPPVTPKVVEPTAAPTSPSASIGAVFAKKNAKTLGIVGAERRDSASIREDDHLAAGATSNGSGSPGFKGLVQRGIEKAVSVRGLRMSVRPEPNLWQVIYAVVGSLAPLSLLALILPDDGPTILVALLSLLMMVGGLFLENKFPGQFTAGVLATTVLTVPLFSLAITASGGEWSSGRFIVALLFSGVALLLLYLFEPHVAGFTPLLGGAVAWIVSLVIYTSVPSYFRGGELDGGTIESYVRYSYGSSLALLLILGLVALGGAFALDRKGIHGASTALLVNGIALMMLGLAAVAEDVGGSNGAGVGLILGGLVLVVIGQSGGRRFSLWFGGSLIFIGIPVAAAQDSASGTAALCLVLAFGLGFGAFSIKKVIDGGSAPSWLSALAER